MELSPVARALLVLVVSLPALALAGNASTAAPATPAAAPAASTGPDIVQMDRKLQENTHRITQISRGLRKIGSLVIASRKGGVVGDVVQLPLVQIGALNTGDTLDKYVIASSRKGYLFSWPDGAKLYFGGSRYFAGAGCTGQAYVRYEFLPLSAQYLGAVFVDDGNVVMVPPRGSSVVTVRSSRDGGDCTDREESSLSFGAVLPNSTKVSGVPNIASFRDDLKLRIE